MLLLLRVCTEEEATFIRSVCKRIIAKIKEHPEIKFIDLTHIFDGDEPIYIDRFHYSPKGNRIYAEALTKQINAFTIRDASKRTKTHTPRKNESKRPYGATNPTVQEGLTYVRWNNFSDHGLLQWRQITCSQRGHRKCFGSNHSILGVYHRCWRSCRTANFFIPQGIWIIKRKNCHHSFG